MPAAARNPVLLRSPGAAALIPSAGKGPAWLSRLPHQLGLPVPAHLATQTPTNRRLFTRPSPAPSLKLTVPGIDDEEEDDGRQPSGQRGRVPLPSREPP